MMHPAPEQEAIAKIQGLKPYFTAGPQPADRKLFLGFSLLTVLRPLNSVLLHLSSISFLLGMVAYVYGDALAMVAPALCLVWLRVNLLVFRQPVHYLIFLAAYGASLVSITISSIVWMALMANKDNVAKHKTVALVYVNDRYVVVVVWFMLQLLIAVLGSTLLYLTPRKTIRPVDNMGTSSVVSNLADVPTSAQAMTIVMLRMPKDGVGSVPQEAEAETRPAQKTEKGFLKMVKTGIAAAKVAEDATRLGRSIEKTAKARQSGNARPEKEAEAAFEQVSAAGKLTQDSAKLARMTKQTKVNEVRTAENQEYVIACF
ncbi:hypothetical protein AAVH_12932 [Aphelenchoides avenae]|nr:hypothetical protein AAVH_12932 [Aphelenchus avenae]